MRLIIFYSIVFILFSSNISFSQSFPVYTPPSLPAHNPTPSYGLHLEGFILNKDTNKIFPLGHRMKNIEPYIQKDALALKYYNKYQSQSKLLLPLYLSAIAIANIGLVSDSEKAPIIGLIVGSGFCITGIAFHISRGNNLNKFKKRLSDCCSNEVALYYKNGWYW